MTPTIFVTGGAGFVGSRLVPALAQRGHAVVALDRSGRLEQRMAGLERVRIVRGDLLSPDTYRTALASCDVVAHLAALTGRGSRHDHFQANAVATETLLAQCHAKRPRFLFVSSIATAFPDIRHYDYAQAKARAEDAVRRSGLRYAILRPTMILGQGSPILVSFEKLAMLPVMPMFGGGETLVQPVHVDDVVEYIAAVIEQDLFSGETFEVGGRDRLTIAELLQRIRQTRVGRRGRAVTIPIGLVRAPLLAAESIGLGRVLPLSVGQLSTFRYDGTAKPSVLQKSLRPGLRDLDQMLSPGVDAAGDTLERECRVFTKHLIDETATAYVVRKYSEAHAALPALSGGDKFDAFLVRVASRHHWGARLADSYARLFLPHTRLRQKLVVLLAVLETCPPSFQKIDASVGGSRSRAIARLGMRGVTALVSATIGTLLFVPARVAFAAVRRKP
jgi:nucleoside-diphosphate-sugar epimerase